MEFDETISKPIWYIPSPHAKLQKNWCTSFREKSGQDTEGHSFIIIRMKNYIFSKIRQNDDFSFYKNKSHNLICSNM